MPELFLFLQSLLQILVFLPGVHRLGAAFILLVLLGLAEHELLVQIALGFEDQDFTEGVLVLFGADPLLMGDLLFVLAGLLDQGLVLGVDDLSVVGAVSKADVLVLFEVCCLVQSVEKAFILVVFPFFIIHLVFVV